MSASAVSAVTSTEFSPLFFIRLDNTQVWIDLVISLRSPRNIVDVCKSVDVQNVNVRPYEKRGWTNGVTTGHGSTWMSDTTTYKPIVADYGYGMTISRNTAFVKGH